MSRLWRVDAMLFDIVNMNEGQAPPTRRAKAMLPLEPGPPERKALAVNAITPKIWTFLDVSGHFGTFADVCGRFYGDNAPFCMKSTG